MLDHDGPKPDPTEVTSKATEGVRVTFVNPEALRVYILDPENYRGAAPTLAERMSGIREIRLGEYPLDGYLLKSTRFSLVIEPDRDPRGDRPTAIIRADLQLGRATSSLATFQKVKKSQHETEDLLGEIWKEFNILPERDDVYFMQYTANTAQIYPHPLERETYPRMPLALLQVWDKDVGAGYISISLLAAQKYDENWRARIDIYKKRIEDGREVDYDEVDRWQFNQQVGINVYATDDFYRSLNFFEQAFALILRAIYQAEKTDIPARTYEIESPLISREQEEVVFADIGGQKTAVDFMRALVEMEESLVRLSKKPLVLLAGPPGNGKTSLAQATANELGARLLVATTTSLPPQAEEADFMALIEAGYFEAKAAAKLGSGKAVYCIEAIETILGQDPRFHDRLLNVMDFWATDSNSDVLVIATSNFPDKLHPGILSRFQRVDVLQPTREGLADILEIKARKLASQAGRQDLFGNVNFGQIAQQIAQMTDFSGRDAEALLAKAYYLRRLQMRSGSSWQPIDSKFLVSLIGNRRAGFRPPST